MRLTACLVLPLALACSGNRTAESPAPGDSMVGTVRIVGSDPLSQVVLDRWEDGQLAVLGDLRDEIGGLSGAVLRVAGQVADNVQPTPDRAIRATAYEVLSVQGRHPYVGVLQREGDALTLLGLRLEAGGASLASLQGRRVWVIGTIEQGTLRVEAYGLIGTP